MKVTPTTRRVLHHRREIRRLTAEGFECTFDFDWRLTRGGMQHHVIAEVRISSDGKQVWYRLEKREAP